MGTYSVVFVILNSVTPAAQDITQFLVQRNSRGILQLIKDISNYCQKLLRYFNETAIFAFFKTPLLPSAVGLPEICDFYLNNFELFVVTFSGLPASVAGYSSLLNSHKLSDVSE